MNKGIIVIACYKPKPGKEQALKRIVTSHISILNAEDLVTERRPIIMEAMDGTIVEVFEWKSKEAIDLAHTNPRVQKMWEEFSMVCNYVPIAQVEEALGLFSEFTPFDPSE